MRPDRYAVWRVAGGGGSARPRTRPRSPPPAPRQWPSMGVVVGGWVGVSGSPHRPASDAIGVHRAGWWWWACGPPPSPPTGMAPGSPPGRRGRAKNRHGVFFFFFPQGGPNRIRSGAKIGVFFCQGCQSRRSDPTRREFAQNRCYFFSPGNFFGKNANITAINDGFLSVFHGGGVR